MKIYCQGIAEVRHMDTGVVYEIHSDELDWNQDGGDEGPMGGSLRYVAEVDHPNLGLLAWEIWEYPIGAEEFTQTDSRGHEVLTDFDYGLEHEPEDEPEDWANEEAPSNPFSIFKTSVSQANTLLTQVVVPPGSQLLNRMVFSHHITAMEAYLGDALLNEVMEDPKARNRLLTEADGLADTKFSLADISKAPNIVQEETRKYLRDIIFHNLAKVDVLYNIALGIRLIPLMSDKSSLFKAVHLRHDCVHRNGADKDGKELTIFTKEFVQETGDQVLNFVQKLNLALIQRKYTAA